MGHRLSKITTRTGDAGETGLSNGSRAPKDSPRIEAIGDVDELNTALGLISAEPLSAATREIVLRLQHDLFDLGGELSLPRYRLVTDDHVRRVEALIERLNADLPPLREFILPGGTRAAAAAHFARTVCRRTERAVVTLAREAEVSATIRVYLNRLSDLLFILGRTLNREAGQTDTQWRKPDPAPTAP